jgi:hypothetical protein
MGGCCSQFVKSQTAGDLLQYGSTGKGDDDHALLAPQHEEILVQLATHSAPLLSGVNFAATPYEDVSSGDSSIDNDEIEQMLQDGTKDSDEN